MKSRIVVSLEIDTDLIKSVLRQRGLSTTQKNVNRTIDMLHQVNLIADEELIQAATADRELLLMYGFQFARDHENNSGSAPKR